MNGIASTIIRLHPDDDVAVARTDLLPGTPLAGESVTTAERIPAGHKVALRDIAADAPIRKYGQIIGFATLPISIGAHVHVHNVGLRDFERDYAACAEAVPTDFLPPERQATFQGYRRPNGRVGTRNYIGVLTSVNCSATVARYTAQAVGRDLLDRYPNVDGVVSLVHGTGCGMADSGEGYANLQRVLWGYLRNPNFAGVVLVGLGCEVNQIDFLLEAYGIERGPLFQTFNIQQAGGTRRAVAYGVDLIEQMLPHADAITRQPVPASELTLALQCGGSDAYSGITANPALGAAAGPSGAPRRHGDPQRDAGDLWRRTSPDPAGCQQGRRR